MNFTTTLTLLLLVSFTNNFTAAADLAIEAGEKYKIKAGLNHLYIGLEHGTIVTIIRAQDITNQRLDNPVFINYILAFINSTLTREEKIELSECNTYQKKTNFFKGKKLEEILDPKYHGPFFHGHFQQSHSYLKNKTQKVYVHLNWLESPIKDKK